MIAGILCLSSKSIGKFWFFLTRERKFSLNFLFSAIAFDQFGRSRAKFVFLDFLEFKAFQAGKNNITFRIYLRAIRARKQSKIDFLNSATKFKFYLIFGDFCSYQLVSSMISPLSLPNSSVFRPGITDFLSFKLVSATIGLSLMPGDARQNFCINLGNGVRLPAFFYCRFRFIHSLFCFRFSSGIFFAILPPVYLVYPAYLRLQGLSGGILLMCSLQ